MPKPFYPNTGKNPVERVATREIHAIQVRMQTILARKNLLMCKNYLERKYFPRVLQAALQSHLPNGALTHLNIRADTRVVSTAFTIIAATCQHSQKSPVKPK